MKLKDFNKAGYKTFSRNIAKTLAIKQLRPSLVAQAVFIQLILL